MPILGVIDSGKSGHLSTNNFSSIATQTVGSGGATNVTFSSIPSTYTHLQIRCISQLGSGSGNEVMSWNFNGDTTSSNYRTHYLSGGGTSVSAGTYSTFGSILGAQTASPSGYSTSIFGVAIIDILDYANTNKYKVTRALTGFDTNGSSANVWYSSGLWQSTSAINSITIKDYASTLNLNQYSSFALYGIL